MKRFLIIAGLLLGLPLLLLIGSWTWTWSTPPALEVGPDTTVLTEPLREDGTVDYIAAVNARLSEGVTTENNAYVAIAGLMMPSADNPDIHREKVFDKLGIAMPGEDAAYFVPFEAYGDRQADENPEGPWAEEADEDEQAEAEAPLIGGPAEPLMRMDTQWERALDAPWAAEDTPLVAEWLNAQADPFDRLVEGINRERYWAPWATEESDGLVLDVLLPHLGAARPMANGLRVRAMHRLHRVDIDAAIDDAIAIRRFGQHLSTVPMMIEQFVGLAIGSQAVDVVGHVAAHDDLTVEQARRLQREWNAVAQRFPIEQALEGERYMPLDIIQRLESEMIAETGTPVARSALDRNHAMRRFNRMYDEMVNASQAESRTERARKLDDLKQRIETRMARWSEPSARWLLLVAGHRGTITDAITDQLTGILMPSLGRAVTVADRGEMEDRLASVAIAVGGYRAEHGRYPESLEAITPDWLDEIPTDIFDEQARPVRYRLEPNRVIIYSFGVNGEDDGGTEGDRRSEGDLIIDWAR